MHLVKGLGQLRQHVWPPLQTKMVEVNAHQEVTVPCLQDGAHDTIGNDGDNVDQSINRIASSVVAQILPEVRGQVIEALTSIRPPSNDLPTSNESGTTFSNISC